MKENEVFLSEKRKEEKVFKQKKYCAKGTDGNKIIPYSKTWKKKQTKL